MVISLLFASTPGAVLTAQQSRAPASQPERPSIQATAEAVIVDVVVRDKKGRSVNDIKPEEIEVFEAGVKQEIGSFRLVQPEIAFEETQAQQPQPQQPTRPATLDHINLVTFAFDGLGTDGRHLALRACEDFIKSELHKNVLVSVFKVDRRLHVLQQFTNDAKVIRDAVRRATGAGTYAQYTNKSNEIKKQLETVSAAAGAAETAAASFGRGNPGGGAGATFAEAKLASVTLDSLQFSEAMEREDASMSSVYSLLALVRGQKQLAGRKTVIYFSEGLIVSQNRVTTLKAMISDANRANVSFYAVDARGLTSASLLDSSKSMMEDAASASRAGTYSSGGRAVSTAEVRSGENAEGSLRANAQGTLQTLSEETGGLLIANTNDLSEGVQRVGEDIRGYYELTYSPKEIQYDGSFRAISVKVSRSDVSVQSRSGYFAVPPTPAGGPPVMPFEMPMLAALVAPSIPKDFEYRAQVLKFGRDAMGLHHVLAIEVPMQNFTFEEVKAEKNKVTYRTRFDWMAVIKDASGQIVEKFSQPYGLQDIPADKIEAMKKGNAVFIRQFSLPEGRYTLEAVAHEEVSQKTSAKRSAILVPQLGDTLRISSLTVIRRTDPPGAEETAATNPLVFTDPQTKKAMKVVPNLGEPVSASPEAVLGLYLVLYPAPGGEKPRLALEVLKDGVSLGGSEMKLPEPDKDGRIAYTASLPLRVFKPGQYELKAVAQQGQQTAEEHAFVTIQ